MDRVLKSTLLDNVICHQLLIEALLISTNNVKNLKFQRNDLQNQEKSERSNVECLKS